MLFWATENFVGKIHMHLTIEEVQAHHVLTYCKHLFVYVCMCVYTVALGTCCEYMQWKFGICSLTLCEQGIRLCPHHICLYGLHTLLTSGLTQQCDVIGLTIQCSSNVTLFDGQAVHLKPQFVLGFAHLQNSPISFPQNTVDTEKT